MQTVDLTDNAVNRKIFFLFLNGEYGGVFQFNIKWRVNNKKSVDNFRGYKLITSHMQKDGLIVAFSTTTPTGLAFPTQIR